MRKPTQCLKRLSPDKVLYPLVFHPLFKERVWGGRGLETLFGKKLPPGKPIGESWEISDRPNDESVVANGKFTGETLHQLMEKFRHEILGDARPAAGIRVNPARARCIASFPACTKGETRCSSPC